MDVDALPPNSVILNVYDVGEEELVKKVNRYSTLNDKVLIGGVYHAGVQIYGQEWGYGGTEEQGITGVCDCPPRLNWQHTYKCTIDLGVTQLSMEEVQELLDKIRRSPMWEGINYDLLHHNCLHFANLFCNRLGVRKIPGWLDRFGRAAVNLQNFTERVQTGMDRTQQLARSVSTNVESVVVNPSSALEAGAVKVQETGSTIARWGQGLFSAATRESVSHWGQGLFAAASRAVGDDPNRRQKRTDLTAALRNRGGIKRTTGPAQSSSSTTQAPESKPRADNEPQQRKASPDEEADAFLLLDEPDTEENDENVAERNGPEEKIAKAPVKPPPANSKDFT
jgi:hypothetical protein